MFSCRHCGHRLDLHARNQHRLDAVEQASLGAVDEDGRLTGAGPVFGPEILTCFYPGCSCRFAELPSPPIEGIGPIPAAYAAIMPSLKAEWEHLEIERLEAEFAES